MPSPLKVSSQKMDIEEAPYLRLIIESIRRTAEYASDIAEIVLNLTVNRYCRENDKETCGGSVKSMGSLNVFKQFIGKFYLQKQR